VAQESEEGKSKKNVCERDVVLHPGSSLFIELNVGGERPPQRLLAVAQRPRLAGLGQGAAAPVVGPPLPGLLAAGSNGHPNVSLVTIRFGSKSCSRFCFSIYLFKIFFWFSKNYIKIRFENGKIYTTRK